MNKHKHILWALVPALFLSLNLSARGAEKHDHPELADHKMQKSPEGARSYIVLPRDGRTVRQKFKVVFGIQGMGVCPAGITASGEPIPDTGHHHLLVNVDKLPPLNVPLPADQPEKILHFGKGQTETMLELPPGKYTLQLVFADYAHVPHVPPVISEKITVTVE